MAPSSSAAVPASRDVGGARPCSEQATTVTGDPQATYSKYLISSKRAVGPTIAQRPPEMKNFTLLCLALSACSSSPATTTQPRDSAVAESITPEDVVWTQLVHAVAAGGVLSKSGGQSGLDDSGAVSVAQLTGGDGWLAVTVDETQAFRFVGLARPHTSTTGAAIDFSFRLQAGRADLYERGVYRADNTVVTGDTLRVVVAGGVVRYEKNGKTVFT